MGPMDMIGQPQQMLGQGIGAPGGGAGPTMPPQMMPQQQPPGMGLGGMSAQAAMQDPRIMAYIRALTMGGGMPGQAIR